MFFTQPTSKAMKPCPFFLEGRCRFESTACKFSHGHIVSFSDLLTYQEPDYKCVCLCVPFQFCKSEQEHSFLCILTPMAVSKKFMCLQFLGPRLLFVHDVMCVCLCCLSLACVGGKCLAKYSDDIWYPAIIRLTLNWSYVSKCVWSVKNLFQLI